MANARTTAEKKENEYSGYRSLLDMTDSTQYALLYNNGRPVKPLLAFNKEGGKANLPRNATLLAVDDEYAQSDKAVASAIVRIKTNADGKISHILVGAAEYERMLFERLISHHPAAGATAARKNIAEATALDFPPVLKAPSAAAGQFNQAVQSRLEALETRLANIETAQAPGKQKPADKNKTPKR